MTSRLPIETPAKVNLHLRVFPPTADGFHPLRSWFRTVDLYDSLMFREALSLPTPGRSRLLIESSDPSLPQGPLSAQNLAAKGWNAAGDATGDGAIDASLTISKTIPAGGGLGGGSSNAAAALVAERRMREQLGMDDLPSDDTLRDLAKSVGSDVPFFLEHHLRGMNDAVVTGRGEVVRPFAARRRHVILLILPGIHVSTPQVFKAFDALPPPPDDGDPDFQAWSTLPADGLAPLLRNDLEAAAFKVAPPLGPLRDDCERRLERPVRMSGSGSSLFALYDDADEAAAAARRLELPTRVA